MKWSFCRGSPNLHFTNSTDGGVWQNRGQPGNPLYLCASAVFQIFFKTLSVTNYSSECFCLHKYTNNILCSFMRYVIKHIFIHCAFVGRELVLWCFVPVFFCSYQFCDQLTDIHKYLGWKDIGGQAKLSIFNLLHTIITKL